MRPWGPAVSNDSESVATSFHGFFVAEIDRTAVPHILKCVFPVTSSPSSCTRAFSLMNASSITHTQAPVSPTKRTHATIFLLYFSLLSAVVLRWGRITTIILIKNVRFVLSVDYFCALLQLKNVVWGPQWCVCCIIFTKSASFNLCNHF